MQARMKDNDMLRRILDAPVYEVAIKTPLDSAPKLSARLGCEVLLKREDLQPVFSFKLRGAYNKMAGLSAAERARGVVACSAGNHAQGVAMAAQKLDCVARIVMPVTTPEIKVAAVRKRGAEVILHGEDFDAAQARALELVASEGWVLIHPYDDLDVIAGQGTIGKEILEHAPRNLEAVFVAIGGGGLAAGVGAYVKAVRPEVRVIGVEPVDAASMKAAFEAGGPVDLDEVGLFADGVAVRRVGEETYKICREVVDEIVVVDTDAICAAIKDVFEDTRSILEPAGALSVAGMKAWVANQNRKSDRTGPQGEPGVLVAVACGANMNFDRLRHVAERSELGEQREGLFAATIPEQPGSFKSFCAMLENLNVTEFNYRFAAGELAQVFVGVQIGARSELASLLERLRAGGIESMDLTDNEMAKLHLRHLVGGRAPEAEDEVLYRFTFPERPGALMKFLEQMRPNWNISLFHYRNHGADFGRVLCGMQVPVGERSGFEEFLAELGYPFVEETENPAYRLFL